MPFLRDEFASVLQQLLRDTEGVFAGLFDPREWLLAGVPEEAHCPELAFFAPALAALALTTDDPRVRVPLCNGGQLLWRLPGEIVLAVLCHGWAAPLVLSLWLDTDDAARLRRATQALDEAVPRLTQLLEAAAQPIPLAALPAAVCRWSSAIESAVLVDAEGLPVAAAGLTDAQLARTIAITCPLLPPPWISPPAGMRQAASISAAGGLASIPIAGLMLTIVTTNPLDGALAAAGLRTLGQRLTSTTADARERRRQTTTTSLPAPLLHSASGNVFHHPWCPRVSRIKPENRRWLASRSEAIARDLLPCPQCDPHSDAELATLAARPRRST